MAITIHTGGVWYAKISGWLQVPDWHKTIEELTLSLETFYNSNFIELKKLIPFGTVGNIQLKFVGNGAFSYLYLVCGSFSTQLDFTKYTFSFIYYSYTSTGTLSSPSFELVDFYVEGVNSGLGNKDAQSFNILVGSEKMTYSNDSSPITIPNLSNDVNPSNWYNMYLLDKKVHDTNVGKYIEVTHPTTLQKTIIPIVGGFLVAAGGKIGGVAQASEPLREFTNKVNPNTFSTIRGGISPIMFEVNQLTDAIARLKASADQVVIDNLKKEQMIQKTYQEIGTLMAEGSFVYTWVGSALHDALGFVTKFGKKVLPLGTFITLCSSAGGTITMDGTQYTYNVKDGKGSETSANDFVHQATQDSTATSNQEANSGTTTQSDKDADAQSDKEANESIKSAMNSVKKVMDNWYAKLVAGLTLGTFGIDQATKLGIDTSGLAGTNIGVDSSLLEQLLQGNKLGLNLDGLQSIIDGQGIKVDPTNLTGQNIGIDPSGLSGQKVGIDTTGATIDTHVSGNVNVNLNAPDSIDLNAPESIQLDTTGAKMEIDPLSLEGINSLSDSYKTYAEKTEIREQARMTREDTQEGRLKLAQEAQQKLIDNDVTNLEVNNENLGYKVKINKVESELREEDYEEGVNYKRAQKISWKNKDSQETFKTKEGLTLKKGLNSNPQLNQQKTYNDTQLSEGKIRGKEKFVAELLPSLKAIIPETTEGTIKRFADVNPSMRYDFDKFVSNIKFGEV